MIRKILFLLICFFTVQYSYGQSKVSLQISVAGEWNYKLDSLDVGIKQQWFNQSFKQTLKLPGSLNEQNIGKPITLKTPWTASIYDSSFYFQPRLAKYRQPGNIKIPFWLTPNKYYVGAVWYQKTVTIPEGWENKDITLFLERAHIETLLWVDGKAIGMQNSLVAPHVYALGTALKPGKHLLTLRIDNRIKDINVGPDSHSISDQTQGNWNGIVGKMELQASATTYIDQIKVFPYVDQKSARIQVVLKNIGKKGKKGKLYFKAESFNSDQPLQEAGATVDLYPIGTSDTVSVEIPMGDDVLLWDEFHPNLFKLSVIYQSGTIDERKSTTFGMRKFEARGKDLYINNQQTFLRGTVENCVFPLTGYAPMDEASWIRIFKIAKSFGLNHMRFHSYSPPEAAFSAADKMGFYLLTEGPSWANHGSSLGNGKPIDQYIYDETNRINDFYGNYASFCMLAYGNEPSGKQVEYLTKFNNYWKAKDSRHLYVGASVGGSWPVIPNNEVMVRAGARGLAWNLQPESETTYESQINQFKVPFVAHEMGQYCVFPDFREIKKYTGAYHVKNLELFQEDLADHDMADQAHDFMMASGNLQALCYKNEIEKALRTPGYSGFQLLSLNDYTGQGTALVGVLNPFWEEKGYINAKEFSRFCSPTVPLALMPKFVYNSAETFEATIEVAHYGEKAIVNPLVHARLKDATGKVLFNQDFSPEQGIKIGINKIGEISFLLNRFTKAEKLNLEVTIEGTEFANDWDIWVYPEELPKYKTSFYYTTSFDAQAKKILDEGGNVFLNTSGKVVKGKEVVQTFLPVFWNTSWFKMRPPHTLGILLDPKNPAFKNFPTAYHSDLQWWEIVNKTQVMNLEDFPAEFKPLVQPIDTWFMNRRLAMIFEAKVGKGKLLVSSANLSPDLEVKEPVARQLFYSLQRYMQSEEFQPKSSVNFNTIDDLFKTGSREVFDTFTKDSPDELKPKLK
ncbi:MAG: sugar-binding domain-containing protein [Pelobium sp.]